MVLRPSVLATLTLAFTAAAIAQTPLEHPLVTEVATIVREHFFDPDLRGLDWHAQVDRAHGAALDDPDGAIDALLAALETSHTRRFTDDDPAFYQLLGIFASSLRPTHEATFAERFGEGPVTYPGVGWFVESRDDTHFVTGVLDGFPAARAGIRLGDEIVAVDDAPYAGVPSFAGRVRRVIEVAIRRTSGGAPIQVDVIPRTIDAESMFVEAMKASAHTIAREGAQIGYVRPWSFAGARYQSLLESLIGTGGDLAEADALVLDLRGGWGGADPAYLRPFLPGIPSLTMTDRDGKQNHYRPQWTKPLIVLADGGTRSGKEILTWSVKRTGIGTVVGGRTAGAVVAGRPFVLSDGSLLYLAVADVTVDGERLEGTGVAPDLAVPFAVPYAAGADPQRDRAVEMAADQARD